MIEQALYEHLKKQPDLIKHLTTYNKEPAIFNQEAPSDKDEMWADGPQYGRVVFAIDTNGDPERDVSAMLSVDIMCKDGETPPEEIEPLLRKFIHGYFFTGDKMTLAAQWKNSSYFTQPTDHVLGCTLTFELLGFPLQTTIDPDTIDRINEWTSKKFKDIHVINYDKLPSNAWKPTEGESAIYWRLQTERPAGWIPDTYQTIWRTAVIKGNVYSAESNDSTAIARIIVAELYADKRLLRDGESPIMVNQNNNVQSGVDPLRTGQITVEGTFGIIVTRGTDGVFNHLNVRHRKES